MPAPAAQPSPLAMLAFAARGAFVVGLLAVTVLSLAPARTLPALDLSDKIEHALAYAFLAATGCFGFGLTRPRAHLWVVIGLSVFGGLIELVQPVLADRTASAADALANQIGIALGWVLARCAGSLLQRREQSRLPSPAAQRRGEAEQQGLRFASPVPPPRNDDGLPAVQPKPDLL